ncbi:MAG: hypothetical protein ACXIVQ_12145 [Acidimicrobiales bacterium]
MTRIRPFYTPTNHHQETTMELTIADIKELISPTDPSSTIEELGADPLDPDPGDKLLIRTVTMTLTGEVVACSPSWIILDDAAWIADTGRFADAIDTGALNEIEPMGHGVRVARAAIVDVTPWLHDLPTDQK